MGAPLDPGGALPFWKSGGAFDRGPCDSVQVLGLLGRRRPAAQRGEHREL